MDNNQPPPVNSQGTMPPVGSYQSQGQPPKPKRKIMGWLIAAVVSCLVICGFCGVLGYFAFNHSGVFIGGKELTAMEVTKGKLEMKQMTKNTKEGDLSSIDTSIETTSPLSTEFKRCFLEIQTAEKTMEKANNEFDADKATSMMLGSQESRDKARGLYKVQNKIAMDYIETESKNIFALLELTKKIEPESVAGYQQGASRLESMKFAYQELIATRDKIMDYLDKTPHGFRNDTVEFDSDKQIAEYNLLSKKHQEAAQKVVDVSKS
jgi:hypothetical protein